MATAADQKIVEALSGALLTELNIPWVEKMVNIDDLNVDLRYQRALNSALVRKITKEYDERVAGSTLVSLRPNGELYIIDGQHKTEAGRNHGKTEVLAQIVEISNWREEAKLRRKANLRKSDTSFERFKNQLAEGDPESVAIDRILRKQDTAINTVQDENPDYLNCVSTIEVIYRKYSPERLSEILQVIKLCFGNYQSYAGSSYMFRALAWLMEKHEYDEKLNFEQFMRIMKASGAESIYHRASALRSTLGAPFWRNHYRAMIEFYNQGKPASEKLSLVETTK